MPVLERDVLLQAKGGNVKPCWVPAIQKDRETGVMTVPWLRGKTGERMAMDHGTRGQHAILSLWERYEDWEV